MILSLNLIKLQVFPLTGTFSIWSLLLSKVIKCSLCICWIPPALPLFISCNCFLFIAPSGGVWSELHLCDPAQRDSVGLRGGQLRPSGTGQLRRPPRCHRHLGSSRLFSPNIFRISELDPCRKAVNPSAVIWVVVPCFSTCNVSPVPWLRGRLFVPQVLLWLSWWRLVAATATPWRWRRAARCSAGGTAITASWATGTATASADRDRSKLCKERRWCRSVF